MAIKMRRAWTKYDVFLSFSGSNVRKGFVDHLYRALTAGNEIRVFHDAHQLKKGDDINATLKHAIECSRIRIPILSPDYASSVWCLKEAHLIATQVRGRAIPLFYKMAPWQVRHPERHGSPFAQAFQDHESGGIHNAEDIERWRCALFKVSNLSGWTLEDTNG